jgi:uncharacterized protein (TIGR03086 family)
MSSALVEGDVMDDLLNLYRRGSEWAIVNVAGATEQLQAHTPCDRWDVRTLMNHMLDTQQYFAGAARGEDVAPPSANPPSVISDNPVADFQRARDETLRTFGNAEILEKTGPMLGIALSDQLLHSWDLAKATGQDATMPEGLPEAAYKTIHGRFTDEQRIGVFKPELPVPPEASFQDRLLAYTGRDPSQ